MHNSGASVKQIRSAIETAFGPHYATQTPTPLP
ncbi:MAG: hypothetical protein CL486_00180 [Acidobacteria bacterium]|nr:hypothetical protein [Acidobacteriota bacterium]